MTVLCRCFKILMVFFGLGFFLSSAHAQLDIAIDGTGVHRIPIAIGEFSGDQTNTRILVDVIRSDLEKSGFFRLIDPGITIMPDDVMIDYPSWKSKATDLLVVGSLEAGTSGRLEARFRLYDINRQTQLAGVAYGTTAPLLRVAGHRIADAIYQAVRHEQGVFSTRIAYVIKHADRFQLQIADWDGQNAQTALISKEPIISPAWSPDGTRIAYVSFENKKPVIYSHSLATGQRSVIANFKGSNSAPSWSPTGAHLAVVLTKDGGSQIYNIGADGSGVKRLTTSSGIDTEPFYTSDGKMIYFTSDRGGGPQIYRMNSTGEAPERVTYSGNYNVSPRVSPDGGYLAYISRNEGRFQLSIIDMEKRESPVTLTSTSTDESPSFSPNGRMILYTTQIDGRGVLAMVSRDGKVRQRLSLKASDVREPVWGPYLH